MAAKIVQGFVFGLTISTALALTCYKCDSSENKLCAYGISSFTYSSVDCNEDLGSGTLTGWFPKQCVKIVAKDDEGKEYIARGCMPHTGGACTAVASTLKFFSNLDGGAKDLSCSTCDSDKCNPADRITSFTFLGIVLAAFVFLL